LLRQKRRAKGKPKGFEEIQRKEKHTKQTNKKRESGFKDKAKDVGSKANRKRRMKETHVMSSPGGQFFQRLCLIGGGSGSKHLHRRKRGEERAA
jgi:hypothetical protein